MKILCVIDHFGSGGAQRQMVALASGLKAQGHDVVCFSYFSKFDFFRPVLDDAGVSVVVAEKKGRLGINVLRGLRRILSRQEFQVVIAFMETPSIYAELAALGLPIQVIASERIDPVGDRLTLYQWTRSVFHRAADVVVANSGAARDIWVRMSPGLASRFRVIRNGVDLSHFVPGDNPDSGEGIRLVGMGTVVERKNVHGLVSALSVIKARGEPVPHVTWVGKDEAGVEGATYRAFVNTLLRERELEGHWSWAGEQKDVRPYLSDAHALIHPSFREGLANVICEALAVARPVLASAVGDNHWLVGREERGLLFDPQDPKSIAGAISRFSLMSREARASLGGAAREFAERELGFEQFVANYEKLFKSSFLTRKPSSEV